MRRRTPADLVISYFGSINATARALGINPSSVSRWRTRGGYVPRPRIEQLMELTKLSRLHLTVGRGGQ